MANKPFNEDLADSLLDVFKVFLGTPTPSQIERLREKANGMASSIMTGSKTASISVCKRLQDATIDAFKKTEDDLEKLREADKELAGSQSGSVKSANKRFESLEKKYADLFERTRDSLQEIEEEIHRLKNLTG